MEKTNFGYRIAWKAFMFVGLYGSTIVNGPVSSLVAHVGTTGALALIFWSLNIPLYRGFLPLLASIPTMAILVSAYVKWVDSGIIHKSG